MNMHLTIIIPTYNRAESLARTLDSILQVNLPSKVKVDVLVVDNNSPDHTKHTVEESAKKAPFPIRHILETRQGSNHARNRGIAEAQGSHLVFTDDDVIVEPEWLNDFINAFRNYPDAACVTGRVVPRFFEPRPEWLSDDLLSYYGEQNFGEKATCLIFPKFPVEMNMAFTKNTLTEIGGFSTLISRDAKTLMSNDGMIFFNNLAENGLQVMYIPGALLFHLIPPERISQKWILSRVYWQGVSDVAVRQILTPKSRFSLMAQAWSRGKGLLKAHTGGHISPRRIYWFCSKIDFKYRVNIEYTKGVFTRSLKELMRI